MNQQRPSQRAGQVHVSEVKSDEFVKRTELVVSCQRDEREGESDVVE